MTRRDGSGSADNLLNERTSPMGTPRPTQLADVGTGTTVTKPVVVLFDVDETLVHTGGSGARSWKAAFDKLYGIDRCPRPW
jgi:hypothetical protein